MSSNTIFWRTHGRFNNQSSHRRSGGGTRHVFIGRLNTARSALTYPTYLGASATDVGHGVAVDSLGNTYVTGETNSTNFPLASAFQGTPNGPGDAFLTKINAAGSTLVYSTYLGANVLENGNAVVVDASGSAYVAGLTHSTNFPTVAPIQASQAGQYNGFVTKFTPAGTSLVY